MKRTRTAEATRPPVNFACLSLCTLLICTLASPSQPPEQTVLDAISRQLDQGDYKLALDPAKLAWERSTPGSKWRWQFQLLYAQVLLFNQFTPEADHLLKDAPPPKYAALLPRYQYLKSYVLFRTSDPLAAERWARAAAEGARALHDSPTEIEALLLLANYLRNPHRAQEAAQQAYRSAHAHGLPIKEAAALLNLGFNAMQQNQFAAAIPYFKQTIPLADSTHAHFLHVLALSNLGECYYSLGDFDRAFRILLEARPLLRSSDESLILYVNYELGSVYLLRRQMPEAVAAYRIALGATRPERWSNGYAMCAVALAQALIEQGAIAEAVSYNDKAQAASARAASPDPDTVASIELNRADIASARGTLQPAADSCRKVILSQARRPASPLQWSAFAKLAALQEKLGQWNLAKHSYENALHSIEASRSAQQHPEYQITYLSSLIRFYQQYVLLLINQHQEQTALAVADSSRASVLTQGSRGSRELPDFAARLRRLARDSNSVILFYWMADKASYLWAITPTGARLLPLPPEAEISRDVQSYSAFIQSERQDTLAAANIVGKRLYRTLLGPVADCVPPGSRVVIVPDGALHSLNFETLLTDTPKPQYWIQDVTVTIAPSLAVLLAHNTPASKSSSSRTLLFGNPDYTGTEFSALPQSADEMESVRKRFAGSVTLISRRAAQVAEYEKSHPERFATIHFLAHVEADAQSPLDSAIVLSPSDAGMRLYARDVARIPLTASLVTISGCWGAGARALSGEGLVGFAWASFYAGARNVVTSLWSVDDRSTAGLMDSFYAGVVAGRSYSEALREAKLAMLKSSYRKPYYWAPFQLYSRAIATQ